MTSPEPIDIKKPTSLKILHTSDWHIGRRLYGHTRYQEFTQFFNWLYQCIIDRGVDILIVAGDIFDNMTPSNKSQALYFEFLGRLINSQCQHVVVVAGNHDSPSLLDAPKALLKSLSVYVVGRACDDIGDEVLVLINHSNQQPQVIISAVPYLRDKDVRNSLSGESSFDKNSQLIEGIKAHYSTANEIAKQKQADIEQEFNIHVPIIATGHLFATGGKVTEDDGVRDLYVGSLGQVGADTFADNIDYVALGHLHIPQLVGGCEHIRYSGSPIPMGFGEAKQEKQVLCVTFTIKPSLKESLEKPLNTMMRTETLPLIEVIKIPCFHKLAQIKGDIEHISHELTKLKQLTIPVWIEVIYKSEEIITDLSEQLQKLTTNSLLSIIKIKNTQTYQRILKKSEQAESLQELTHHQVFSRCLDMHDIADNQKGELTECFQQIVYELEHDDSQAE